MLQRSSLPSTGSADTVDAWRSAIDRPGLQALRHTLQLPTTWQQYVLLLVTLLLILAGMSMHILLTVQIAEAEYQVYLLKTQYEQIERQNSELIYQISMHSSLEQMASAAQFQGYKPAMSRTYIYRDQLAGGAIPGVGGGQALATVGADATTQTTASQDAETPNGDWLAQGQQWLESAQAASGGFVTQIAETVTGWTR
ncbi:MAG: hypothetical protein IPK16_09840 [Anaerolineales bacterium]|nr:hypothetical protein [Anaerolineales bacterium]